MLLTFRKRLLLLALSLIAGLLLTGILTTLLGHIMVDRPTALVRIAAVCQNLLAFILPAVGTALLITRLPADLLMLRRAPGLRGLLLALGVTVCSIPAVTAVEQLCEMIPWPGSVLAAEAAAEAAVTSMMGPHTPANLIVCILIIGLLTGLAEELFFRGALQGILRSRPMSVHAAVWITAVVFSLFHFQPVGFFARTLLGAMFGYFVIWTGSLWTAVAAHALNNALAVTLLYLGIDAASVLTGSFFLPLGSLIASGVLLALLRR